MKYCYVPTIPACALHLGFHIYWAAIVVAMTNTTEIGWQPQPTGRGTFGLLCTCVFTIVLSLWTAYHPDIEPLRHRNRACGWSMFARVTRSCVFTLCPGWMVAEAAKQHVHATRLTTTLNNLGYDEWSITHSFYAFMNGFIAQDETGVWRDLDFTYVEDLHDIDRDSIPSKTEILDRSKADCFAKVVVVCEIVYIVSQSISRIGAHLPISTLEVATMGYAAVSLIAYSYWWRKPYCVRSKTMLQRKQEVAPFPLILPPQPRTFIAKSIVYIEALGPSLDSLTDPETSIKRRRRGRRLPTRPSQAKAVNSSDTLVKYHTQVTISETSSQFSESAATDLCRPATTSSDNIKPPAVTGPLPTSTVIAFVANSSALLVANTVFHLIHISAWNLHFPTRTEKLLWRIFACCPILLTVLLVGAALARRLSDDGIASSRHRNIFRVAFWVFVMGLSCSRMYLFVEMFVGLRSAEAGIYDTVEWIRYLPTVA